MASAQPSGSVAPAKEYTVRTQSDSTKKYSIMKFNIGDKVNFTECGPVKIERENNLRDFKAAHNIDVMPKFGAGSEFGREQKDEARRKKYGMATKKYNPYNQPWLLKMGNGKTAKKFKGSKEGGILENTSYFVFTQCTDGAFEASSLESWCNFNPVIKYKFLNADEAEEEFLRRDRNLNYRNLMVRRRLKGEDADVDDEEEKKAKKKASKKKDFNLTDMDEWAEHSDDSESNSDDASDGEKKKKKKAPQKKKSKGHKANSDDEAMEESDDQDEGAEVDYMTSSDSEEDMLFKPGAQRDGEKYEQKGVAEEKGLLTLIDSDAEDEEDEEKKDKEQEQDAKEDGKEEEGKKKKKDESDDSSSSSDSDSDPEKEAIPSVLLMQKKSDKAGKKKRRPSASSEGSATTNSRSATPSVDTEDKAKRSDTASPALKKARMDTPPLHSGSSASEGITEDSVRRYLMRKPMTTKDLLQKFKSKNTGLSKEKLVTTIAQILKRLNPVKQKIKDKLYLSIKKA